MPVRHEDPLVVAAPVDIARKQISGECCGTARCVVVCCVVARCAVGIGRIGCIRCGNGLRLGYRRGLNSKRAASADVNRAREKQRDEKVESHSSSYPGLRRCPCPTAPCGLSDADIQSFARRSHWLSLIAARPPHKQSRAQFESELACQWVFARNTAACRANRSSSKLGTPIECAQIHPRGQS